MAWLRAGPDGVLGVRWGQDADAAAARLGMGGAWEPWEGGGGFEARLDPDVVVDAFGARAVPRLIRRGGELAGAQLLFRSDAEALARARAEVAREYGIEPGEGALSRAWRGGARVRLHGETLTVAGPAFGDAFADEVLRGGLGRLASGLQP
jgi:hypothetical protein